MDERSCAVSFQAVILWLPLFTLRKGSQDLLSYTTRRGATTTLPIGLGFSALLCTVMLGAIAVASVGSLPLKLQHLELPAGRSPSG